MKSQVSNQLIRLERIAEEIRALHQTPLQAIAVELEQTLAPLLHPIDNVEISGPINRLADYLSELLAALPKTFGQRFGFDAALTAAVMDEWNPKLNLRRLALPVYDLHWGYRLLVMPPRNRESTRVIDVFHFRGGETLEEVELLDYPWLIHELGHHLMHVHAEDFPEVFRPELLAYLRDQRVLALADRARARAKADSALNQIEQFWIAGNDQRNWAHEIAFDILALWTCGPAFLNAFCATLEEGKPDPFIKRQDHPPYIVRAAALLYAGRQLGLRRYQNGLTLIHDKYLQVVEEAGQKNELLLFAPQELIRSCVDAAVLVAEKFQLKKWRQVDAEKFLLEPIFGVDLLNAAFEKRQASEASYPEWERAVVSQLAGYVTL
jgi:hypothetical protein